MTINYTYARTNRRPNFSDFNYRTIYLICSWILPKLVFDFW